MTTYKISKYHGKYNRSARYQNIKYIVVHYTGSGTSKSGSAKANCIYFSGGNRNASAHYFIDDANIYEYADPKKYYTWHCGDGHGAYGITNANSIGIEVCLDGDKPYTAKEIDRLTWLVRKLMKDFNVPAKNVVRHYDASRKLCPYYYAKRPTSWKNLHGKITGQKSTSPTTTKSKYVKYVVTADKLNFRKGPGTNYEINRVKDAGSVMNIGIIKNGWGQTKTGDWGSMKYMRKQ